MNMVTQPVCYQKKKQTLSKMMSGVILLANNHILNDIQELFDLALQVDRYEYYIHYIR